MRLLVRAHALRAIAVRVVAATAAAGRQTGLYQEGEEGGDLVSRASIAAYEPAK